MSLQSDLDGERYDDVIVGVREWVAADPSAAFADATTKRWMSLRWKDLFLREAVQDDAALATAGKRVSLANPLAPRLGKDTRSDRQKIADRFLKDVAAPDWQIELPDPTSPSRTRRWFCAPDCCRGSCTPVPTHSWRMRR